MAKITQKDINDAVWKACDTFRGSIDPSVYKDYVLTMLFLKYLSDVHDDKMEGYRKVANYIEAGEYLSNHKLFNAGMNALSDKALRLENLTQPALLEG